MRPLPGLLPSSLGVLTCILLGSPAAPTATCTSLTSQQLPDTTIGDAGHPSAARSLKKLHARGLEMRKVGAAGRRAGYFLHPQTAAAARR